MSMLTAYGGKMQIVLQHPKGHDHGVFLDVEVANTFCEGMKDGCKEYIQSTDGTVYERYSCYSVISPFGYKVSNKSWEEVIAFEIM